MSLSSKSDYDFSEADYELREAITNIKAQVDILSYGALDEFDELERDDFLKKLKNSVDELYVGLDQNVVKKAEQIRQMMMIMKKDLNIAKNIQNKIISQNVNRIRNYKFLQYYRPLMEVGGDFFDIFEIPRKGIRIFLADATGHGIQSALITMLIKSEYEKIKMIMKKPSEVFDYLNFVFRDTYRSLSVLFTAIIIDIDYSNDTITFSSAAHPPQAAFLGGELHQIKVNGSIIGILEDAEYHDEQIEFHAGDSLLLFTDGLYEEFDPELSEYGVQRLFENLNTWKDLSLVEKMYRSIAAVEAYIKEGEYNDDVTILGVEYSK